MKPNLHQELGWHHSWCLFFTRPRPDLDAQNHVSFQIYLRAFDTNRAWSLLIYEKVPWRFQYPLPWDQRDEEWAALHPRTAQTQVLCRSKVGYYLMAKCTNELHSSVRYWSRSCVQVSVNVIEIDPDGQPVLFATKEDDSHKAAASIPISVGM